MRNRQTIFLGLVFSLASINFIYCVYFYVQNKYLPEPFFFDKSDTFMDFYNSLYWSVNEGAYTVWKSVYPPLNFLFLQIYQALCIEDVDHAKNGLDIRALSGYSIIPLLVLFIISIWASIRISYKSLLDIKVECIFFLLILMSPTFLYAVDRGNLIVFVIPILSVYVASRDNIYKALSFAVMVNIKPYLAIFYIFEILNFKLDKDTKDFLILAPLFTLIVFLGAGIIVNQEFYFLPFNLLGFGLNGGLFNPREILGFSSTITSFGYLKSVITTFWIPHGFEYLFKLLVYFYIVKILIFIYKYPIRFDDLVIFSIIFITNYSTSTGGYGLLYYIPAIGPLLKQKNYILIGIIIVSFYIGIWDLIPLYKYNASDMNIYLSGEVVKVGSYISFGSIIRPIANFIVLVLFSNNLKKRYFHEYI